MMTGRHPIGTSLKEKIAARSVRNKDTGCHEWTGSKNWLGYGVICLRDENGNRKSFAAHRAAWMDAHGPIMDGMKVCHRCDNRACVNVDHLFLGTQLDNMRDMQAKGRQNYGHGGRPLSHDEDEVRQAVSGGMPPRQIMAEFCVSKDTAYRWIKKFKSSEPTISCVSSDTTHTIYYRSSEISHKQEMQTGQLSYKQLLESQLKSRRFNGL